MKTRQRLTPAIAPAAVLLFEQRVGNSALRVIIKTGGKPSTWFPPEGLVEQKPRTLFEYNTIDKSKMRHKNKDAKENKRRTTDTTKAGERASQVQEQAQRK